MDHQDRIDSDFHERYRRRPEKLTAAGKTNRRIASELFVSVGTVKTHISNAYRKLSFAASVLDAPGDAAIPRRNG